jgi:hypothetical protein
MTMMVVTLHLEMTRKYHLFNHGGKATDMSFQYKFNRIHLVQYPGVSKIPKEEPSTVKDTIRNTLRQMMSSRRNPLTLHKAIVSVEHGKLLMIQPPLPHVVA